MRAEQLTDPVAFHGEGPVWSRSWGGLRWVDMLAGDILSLAPDGTIERRHVGAVAAAVRPRRRGGAVIGVERGFALEDPDGTITHLDELWSDDSVRMNEGGCDPDGRFYCGSMASDQQAGAASLYRFDPDRSVHVVLDGVTVSNGLEWSPDGTRAYYNDTATLQVAIFDYESDSGLTGRRGFVDTSPGRPDGLTVDSEGGVWVALSNAGAVHRYTPDGQLAEVVEVAARKTTVCTFGGGNLDELFITTSAEGVEPDDDPLAGALFRAVPGVTGLPTREFVDERLRSLAALGRGIIFDVRLFRRSGHHGPGERRTQLTDVGLRAIQRVTASPWLLVQITLAATIAWLIARYLVGNHDPFFAPIAAAVALSQPLGERGTNALRLVLGVVVGITAGELALVATQGTWIALPLATFAAMAVAQAFGGNRLTIVQAASAAILTVTVVASGNEPGIDRLVDALIGAGVALLFSQTLFSPEPVRLVRRAETLA